MSELWDNLDEAQKSKSGVVTISINLAKFTIGREKEKIAR